MRIIPEILPVEKEIIEGENLEIMQSLIDTGYRGKFKLIYFDGPFNSGLLFSFRNMKFEFDYISPWSQFNTIHNYVQPRRYLEQYGERIKLAKELLSKDGIFVLQTNQLFGHHVKVLLDDIFGSENMLPEVIWKHSELPWNVLPSYPVGYQHESIYFYSKSSDCQANQNIDSLLPSIWDDIPGYDYTVDEETYYPSQKPESLVERIVDLASEEGDLVGDFYCGSGTFPYVAEKMGRRFISCDNYPLAIQMTRHRLANQNKSVSVHYTEDEFNESLLQDQVYSKPSQTPFSVLELEGILRNKKEVCMDVVAYSYSPEIDLMNHQGRITFNLLFPSVTEEGFSETQLILMPRPYPVSDAEGITLIVPNPKEWVMYHLVMVERNELNQINLTKFDKGYKHIWMWDQTLQAADDIVSKVNGDWIAGLEEKDDYVVITDIFGYQYMHNRKG